MSYDQAYWEKRKRKYKRGTLLLVIFVTIFVFSVELDQNSGEMCGQCHSMRPQYLTWKASSHQNVGCAECHADTGISGNVQMMKDLGRYTFREVTESYMKPIRLFIRVEDERCLRCHNTDRVTSTTGDIFIPHQDHYDASVRCESCHKSVAHGGIARRGETRAGSKWDEDRAALAMAWENTATTMDECMQCHFRRRVTTECKACHTGLNLPGYHQFTDFGYNHGPAASRNLEECNVCHGYAGMKKMQVDQNTTLRNYSRENTFCKDCHSQLPPSHENNWHRRHGNLAVRGSGEEGCLICHDNRNVGGFTVTRTNCGACHPSPHTPGFQSSHYPDLTAYTRPNQTCYMCHQASLCTGCHGQN